MRLREKSSLMPLLLMSGKKEGGVLTAAAGGRIRGGGGNFFFFFLKPRVMLVVEFREFADELARPANKRRKQRGVRN